MAVKPAYLEAFAPLIWATPLLTSPDWEVRERDRGDDARTERIDRYCRDAMCGEDGIQHWVELTQRPAPGSQAVSKTVSLCKYGDRLGGFPGILHGGAVMTLMDEALGFAMVARETALKGSWTGLPPNWRQLLDENRPLAEILNGVMVTAKSDVKFLKPVPCPGLVGIEVEILESIGQKMKIRGVMKDGNGASLVQADGLWVRIGGAVKL
ncbi:hypothetical protein K505DRAFT_327452 [Melanomma pulvis-pyrius CBS 109.77]|uniref:Thioesterase domain-containing protein n=1 Tax=Melanomma pulvis-pyrius CBS 109.77 TaxID=1314802 RepID=A0A6A6X341_9PLEO|nr:hypothetical protein K505DRAFT_327452 [Melanomma pulvis-pyrius CBS 109.77]